MKWIFTVLAIWILSGAVQARRRYWDADYDSLTRVLPRQVSDSARLRTVLHLLDLHPTNAQAVPLLNQLLSLNQRRRVVDEEPYRRLRAGLLLWEKGQHPAAALDTLKAAIAAFDHAGRPIPWLLIDLVTFYNQLNGMEARKQYYDQKLAFYSQRGARENIAACYISQGGYYRRTGDYNRTLDNILRGAYLARTFSRSLYANELLVAGAVYADWGNVVKAVQYLRRAQAMPEFRHLQGMSRVFTFLALSKLYAKEHRYVLAQRSVDSALTTRLADPYEQEQGRAYGLVQKAAILLQMKQPARAGPLLHRAQQLDDSLDLPISGKAGEFELDATWAQYCVSRRDYARAEAHWLLAYQKATTAKLDKLRPKYLQQLSAFYDARGRPATAQRYSRIYQALVDTSNATQGSFHVAQYESERVEQAKNEQISALRQAQAVQAVRLRLGNWQLLGALLTTLVVSALGLLIFRQLQENRRVLAALKTAQGQLVQAEKMAFLGELTAGIAHELQNPLTFMKNFAEVSTGLVDDMAGGRRVPARDAGLEAEILAGLKQNLQHISQHGQRASSIIKDMLEHSRSGTGPRVPTDLNELIKENLALAYRGLQTRDPAFTATITTAFDAALAPVAVVPSDFGRVLLNLFANGLHALREHQRAAAHPVMAVQSELVVTTRALAHVVEIRVRDNGIGMPESIRDKVFQPFFTTKSPDEGTGLGLSISFDIVTKGHGGTLAVTSAAGVGTEFIIQLPQQ